MKKLPKFSDDDIARIIEMAWEDRTPFDAIESQFKLNEDGVKQLMRNKLKASSYKLWRKRVNSRKDQTSQKRGFNIGKHFSPDQNKLK